MAHRHSPSHPRPAGTPDRATQASHGSAPVLLATMASALLLALVVIVLVANQAANVPAVSDAMLAMA